VTAMDATYGSPVTVQQGLSKCGSAAITTVRVQTGRLANWQTRRLAVFVRGPEDKMGSVGDFICWTRRFSMPSFGYMAAC